MGINVLNRDFKIVATLGQRLKIMVFLLMPLAFAQCDRAGKQGGVPVEIQRFDRDFYAVDTTAFKSGMELVAAKYPQFFPVFVEGVLAITPDYRAINSYLDLLYEFRTHPAMLGLYDSIAHYFPDMAPYEKEFGAAFARYRKFYPGAELPEVVTFVSEFGNKAILYDHGIGISLDMFLGPQYPYYQGLQLPNYIIAFLRGEQIVPNAMRVWAEDHVSPPPAPATLLDVMVYEGKKLYFAEQMLPGMAGHRIIEYAPEQFAWCETHEADIWAFFIEQDVLYDTGYGPYNRYVGEAPTTYGMPPEAPGRTGIWTGWQIVKAYAESRPGASLDEVLQTDARTLLEMSGYKPR